MINEKFRQESALLMNKIDLEQESVSFGISSGLKLNANNWKIIIIKVWLCSVSDNDS